MESHHKEKINNNVLLAPKVTSRISYIYDSIILLNKEFNNPERRIKITKCRIVRGRPSYQIDPMGANVA